MKSITIAMLLSLVVVSPIYGHKIHKRLLENTKEPPSKVNDLLPTTTAISSVVALKEPKVISVTSMQNWSLISSTEAPEILVHPYVEATEVHQSNESDYKVLLEVPTDEKLRTEKPQDAKKTNSSASGKTQSVMVNTISKPLQIIKENCTCFSIRRPNSTTNSQKFENATTSILSEVESEIGILFEIAAGILPMELTGKNTNESSTKISKANSQINNTSEIIEVRNEEPPFFEDFVPFFPLESLISRSMPLETIIIQTESEGVDPSKLFSTLDINKNKTDPIKKEHNGAKELPNPSTTQRSIDKVDGKKTISA